MDANPHVREIDLIILGKSILAESSDGVVWKVVVLLYRGSVFWIDSFGVEYVCDRGYCQEF